MRFTTLLAAAVLLAWPSFAPAQEVLRAPLGELTFRPGRDVLAPAALRQLTDLRAGLAELRGLAGARSDVRLVVVADAALAETRPRLLDARLAELQTALAPGLAVVADRAEGLRGDSVALYLESRHAPNCPWNAQLVATGAGEPPAIAVRPDVPLRLGPNQALTLVPARPIDPSVEPIWQRQRGGGFAPVRGAVTAGAELVLQYRPAPRPAARGTGNRLHRPEDNVALQCQIRVLPR